MFSGNNVQTKEFGRKIVSQKCLVENNFGPKKLLVKKILKRCFTFNRWGQWRIIVNNPQLKYIPIKFQDYLTFPALLLLSRIY